MEGGPPMSRHRWGLFYSFVVLTTLVTVSCSQPGRDLQSAKPAQTATAETVNKSDVEAAPVSQPKPPRAATPKPSKSPAPAAAPAPAPPVAPQQTVARAPQPAPIVVPTPQADPIAVPGPPPPPEPTTKRITIPAGTEVYIRMIDSINAERSHQNETFRASLDKDIVVDGKTIIPRRSDVFVKV